jgi:hypothetical protein
VKQANDNDYWSQYVWKVGYIASNSVNCTVGTNGSFVPADSVRMGIVDKYTEWEPVIIFRWENLPYG